MRVSQKQKPALVCLDILSILTLLCLLIFLVLWFVSIRCLLSDFSGLPQETDFKVVSVEGNSFIRLLYLFLPSLHPLTVSCFSFWFVPMSEILSSLQQETGLR